MVHDRQESHQFRVMVSGYRAWCTQLGLHGHECLARAFPPSWGFVSELCLNEHVQDLRDGGTFLGRLSKTGAREFEHVQRPHALR